MFQKIYLTIIIIVVAFALCSCDDSPTNPSDSSVKPAYERIVGVWGVYGSSTTNRIFIDAGAKYCSFDSQKYTGNWSGTSFNGKYTATKSDTTFENSLSISLDTDVYFSGSSTTKYYVLGKPKIFTERIFADKVTKLP